jgi:hypothetical protein
MSIGRSAGFASPHYFAMESWSSSPYINRFLSADTIVPGYGNPQNLNRYSYVLNNPLLYTDPTGHKPCEEYAGTCLSENQVTQISNNTQNGTDDDDNSDLEFCDSVLGCENPDAGIFCDQFSCWFDGATNISGTYQDPAVYISLAFGGWGSGLFSTSFWGAATACIGNVVCTSLTGMAGGAGAANAGNSSSAWQFPLSGPITQNGITFSKHALERMLPVGLGGRGVPPSVVENVVTIGQRTPTLAQNVVEIVSDNVTVIFNTVTNTVITVIKTGH